MFKGLVQQVYITKLTAIVNQDIPFKRIVLALLLGLRDILRNPLV